MIAHKVVLIDDITELRNHFKQLIADNNLPLTVVAEADNLIEGIKLIKKHQPDIVFLDVEMPLHSGLEIMDFFNEDEIDFHLVFVTAHSHYAINAFQLSAIDFILKPVTSEAIGQSIKKIEKSQTGAKLFGLKSTLSKESSSKLVINTADSVLIVAFNDIVYLKAERAYTNFFLNSGKTIVAAKPLVEFEEILPQESFFRSHRSVIVNLKHVQSINKKNFTISLANGEEVPLAENKKQLLIHLLSAK